MKQDDALSNLLFNIALESAMRRSDGQKNSTIILRSHMLLGFADDIDLFGIDRMVVVEVFVSLQRETTRIGLKSTLPSRSTWLELKTVVDQVVLVLR